MTEIIKKIFEHPNSGENLVETLELFSMEYFQVKVLKKATVRINQNDASEP